MGHIVRTESDSLPVSSLILVSIIIASRLGENVISFTSSKHVSRQSFMVGDPLGCEAKKRYLEKLQVIAGQDPFLLASNRVGGAVTRAKDLPQVEASDIVSYLVLPNSSRHTSPLKHTTSLSVVG